MTLAILESIDQHPEPIQNLVYSKKQVQKAGETLIQDSLATENPELYSKSMKILSHWRACHIIPLDAVTEQLTAKALNYEFS